MQAGTVSGTPRGHLFIAGEALAGAGGEFQAVDPTTGEGLTPLFRGADERQLRDACEAAHTAAEPFSSTTPAIRAALLEAIATALQAAGSAIVARAVRETGLPETRLTGELARTAGQLRLFAKVLLDGRCLDAHIVRADPTRRPLPRPDTRQVRVAVGPVAVFGASNFPLAFSVAGGDTASALAAGCPVIVKGHPAHPGTSELTARVIATAVREQGLPTGIFSLLAGSGHAIGTKLVRDPAIAAVGFTGSRSGGLALMKAAAYRPEPIPVFAEMSSINPVILLSGALAFRAASMAADFVASLTLGAGQFCTSPGLVIAVDGQPLDNFLTVASAAIESSDAQTMLTADIRDACIAGIERLDTNPRVQQLSGGRGSRYSSSGSDNERGSFSDANLAPAPALFATRAADFLSDVSLREEIFGAVSLVVRCTSNHELLRTIESLEGQLTATLQLEPADAAFARTILPLLQERVGRILCNGFPTGVEVGDAMVHGGPFPATSDGRSTSVGAAAIERFLRPVCYQDVPDALLPASLQDANPLGLPRRENAFES